ncbi:unnamed protein product, partial [marine sediment metagenome]
SDNAIIIHEGSKSILQYYDKTNKLVQYCIPTANTFESASSIIDHSERLFYVKSIRSQAYDQREITKIEDVLAQKFELIDSVDCALYIQTEVYQHRKP